MKKLFIGLLLLAALGYGLYMLVFDRANHIYSKLPQVKAGMSRVEVTALLGVPDTTYAWPEAPYPPVLHYEMGLGAPDALRVFLDHDTVTAWSYNLVISRKPSSCLLAKRSEGKRAVFS